MVLSWQLQDEDITSLTKDEFYDFVTKCVEIVQHACSRAGNGMPEKVELLRGLCLADSRTEVILLSSCTTH